jgi:hypothetical protein
MRSIFKLGLAVLAALQTCALPVTAAAQTAATIEARAPVTILVSIDGFRPDYLDRGVTPNLSRLAAEGASAPMRPSFPSKTYPNHWTLVTGLYPDHHGIVANKMEDPARPTRSSPWRPTTLSGGTPPSRSGSTPSVRESAPDDVLARIERRGRRHPENGRDAG